MNAYKVTPLLLAEQIVNTRDTTRIEPEYLRTPADLGRYLEAWGVMPAQEPDAHDLTEMLALRDRLRAVFEADSPESAVVVLNELLDGVPIWPQFSVTAEHSFRSEFKVDGDLSLARRLGAQAALELGGALERYGIERLHVCNATPCSDVFLDTSRNHTRRYCCEQCANRHNVAAHRRRSKAI